MKSGSTPLPPTSTVSRRGFLSLLAVTSLASSGLAACGGSSGPGGAGSATMWYLSGDPNQSIKTDTLKSWNNAHPDHQVKVTFFQNDAYKTKIKTAIGAGQAPTLIYGWGGGTLRQYAKSDQVLDLTDWLEQNPEVKSAVLESTYQAGTVNGKIYAYPNENAAPIVLFYNKELFAKAQAQPPKTWDDLMALVPVFNEMGVAPISLAGQSVWTSMMWLEYLFDRVGGPQVFNDIYNGKPNAWSAPGAIRALTMAQDLVKAKGFIKGFESITADSNADQALLYTGKAAMMLHGSWVYSGMKSSQPEFTDKSLGWQEFPVVSGGKGDPHDSIGNPAQYMSISAKAGKAEVKTAQDYIANGLMSQAVIDQYISTGQVCVASGIEDKIAASPNKDFLSFAYDLVKDAPNFQQSWDQALSPTTATTLLNNISKLFGLSTTPQKFASAMNATLDT